MILKKWIMNESKKKRGRKPASKEKEYDEDEDYYGSFDDEDGDFDGLDINFSGDEDDEE